MLSSAFTSSQYEHMYAFKWSRVCKPWAQVMDLQRSISHRHLSLGSRPSQDSLPDEDGAAFLSPNPRPLMCLADLRHRGHTLCLQFEPQHSPTCATAAGAQQAALVSSHSV